MACLGACAVFVSGLAVVARAQSAGYAELKLAEQAYNRRDFVTAVTHFQAAAAMETTNVKTRLFLANALLARWFSEPADPYSPHAVAAQQQYEQVLAYDPGNRHALHGLAGIAINARRPADALEIARKLVHLDKSDAAAYYTIGVANWAIAYEPYAKSASGAGMHDLAIRDASVRRNLRAKFLNGIDEGLESLERAISLKPDFDEAMAYTNLLLRLKAGIAETEAETQQLHVEADSWVKKAIALQQANKKLPPNPLTINVDAAVPSLADTRRLLPLLKAPPPPPPPPPPPSFRGGDR